jgi:hypothetical protein
MAATLIQKIDETLDHLDNIDSLCDVFFSQHTFTIYKNISVSLRLLLVGSSRQVGLVQDVLLDGRFPPLRKVPDPATPADMIVLPAVAWIERGEARLQLGNGTVTVKMLDVCGGAVSAMRFGEMFDGESLGLPLVDWLQQPFLRPNWTLQHFIKTVTNKDGGAHLDPNNALQSFQQFGYFHWHLTAGMARELSPQIRAQVSTTYPNHVRPIR